MYTTLKIISRKFLGVSLILTFFSQPIQEIHVRNPVWIETTLWLYICHPVIHRKLQNVVYMKKKIDVKKKGGGGVIRPSRTSGGRTIQPDTPDLHYLQGLVPDNCRRKLLPVLGELCIGICPCALKKQNMISSFLIGFHWVTRLGLIIKTSRSWYSVLLLYIFLSLSLCMLITFGLRLYEKYTPKNVFLIWLVNFQNCAAIKKTQRLPGV